MSKSLTYAGVLRMDALLSDGGWLDYLYIMRYAIFVFFVWRKLGSTGSSLTLPRAIGNSPQKPELMKR